MPVSEHQLRFMQLARSGPVFPLHWHRNARGQISHSNATSDNTDDTPAMWACSGIHVWLNPIAYIPRYVSLSLSVFKQRGAAISDIECRRVWTFAWLNRLVALPVNIWKSPLQAQGP